MNTRLQQDIITSELDDNTNIEYVRETRILDYRHSSLQQLVEERQWKLLDPVAQVKQIYHYVRDEILFGYNSSDDIPASQVLKDGYGQCNTKATLFMTLLRAVGVPNRIHGFTIDKALQKGAITGVWYLMSPQNILHSWVEVLVNKQWYYLEGLILDTPYLTALQRQNKDCKTFCGYGAYTDDLQNPTIDFNLNHTYIQDKGINQDFGLFNTPDAFYSKHQQKLGPIKRFLYQNYIRFTMNSNVASIRNHQDT